MKRTLAFTILAVLLAGAAPAGGVLVGSRQAGSSLGALTVPAPALPEGCALTAQPAASPATVLRGEKIVIEGTPRSRSQFPSNPWTGTDQRTVAAIHRAIDPPPPARVRLLPDVPPSEWRSSTARSSTADELKWADNILDARTLDMVFSAARPN